MFPYFQFNYMHECFERIFYELSWRKEVRLHGAQVLHFIYIELFLSTYGFCCFLKWPRWKRRPQTKTRIATVWDTHTHTHRITCHFLLDWSHTFFFFFKCLHIYNIYIISMIYTKLPNFFLNFVTSGHHSKLWNVITYLTFFTYSPFQSTSLLWNSRRDGITSEKKSPPLRKTFLWTPAYTDLDHHHTRTKKWQPCYQGNNPGSLLSCRGLWSPATISLATENYFQGDTHL